MSYFDKTILLLSALFLLHRSPYLGVRYPSIIYAAIVILLFVLLIIQFDKGKKPIRFLFPFMSLVFLDFLCYDLSNIKNGIDLLRTISICMQIIIYPLLSGYIIYKQKYKYGLFLLLFFLSIEFTTYVSSIIAENSFPGIIRLNPGQLLENDASMYSIKTGLNVGNFDTVYGCTVMIPIMALGIKYRRQLFANKMSVIFLYIYFALSIYFVFVSQFTTALIGMVIMLFSLFLGKSITLSGFKRFILVLILGCAILWFSLPYALHYVADKIESPIVAERFEGLSNLLEGDSVSGSDDIDERNRVYSKSLSIIKETSCIGTWGQKETGGHSFFLDTVAKYGLIGILLLIVYYKGLVRLIIRPYQKNSFRFYYVFGLIGTTFFYILNPSELFPQLLFCYPISAYIVYTKFGGKAL